MFARVYASHRGLMLLRRAVELAERDPALRVGGPRSRVDLDPPHPQCRRRERRAPGACSIKPFHTARASS
jgi:hypothetical protein